MGRYVSLALEPTVYFGIRDVKPGYGSGVFRFYGSSGTFLVPLGVTEIRVTALGGGGCGSCFCQCCCCCRCELRPGSGGGGAGYIVATVPVTPGCTCNIAVATAGGASCFSTLVYAYGGCHATVSSTSSTSGAGGTFCACTGSTLVVGYNGNSGCTNSTVLSAYMTFNGSSSSQCCEWGYSCGYGGASGSPIGGGGTGPFPGTLCSDVYSCKGFNGEASSEADIASKFSNTIRWPGETIMSTSRLSATIGGTSAQFPANCYCVSVFGGGGLALCSCMPYACAGCGGGRAGAVPCCWCYCANPYSPFSFMPNGPNYAVCYVCSGFPGNGFVVVEY